MRYDELFKVRFDELGKIITGKTPSTKVNQYWDGKIQFITPKDIQINKYVNETDRYITEEGLNSINNILLGEGAVAVSCIGNIGYVGKIIHKAVTNQQLNTIIPNQYYDSDYVYYLMKNSWSLFKSLENQSTTVSIINKSQFSSLEVSVFKEKKKQKAIANILSSLDDKIELNNKINKNLEEIAQTLYKRWFVDFEFPNENGEPYKSSGGEMVDSELGLIPKGWEVLILESALTFERGIEPGSKNYLDRKEPNTVKFIRVGDLNKAKNVFVDKTLVKDKLVKKDDVLVSFDGAIGRVEIGFLGSYSTGLRKIYDKTGLIHNAYIYFLMKSQNIQDTIAAHANGTTILHAGSSISHLNIAYSESAVKHFTQMIEPIFKKILSIKEENSTLAATRDELLPKLMSGEIRVPVEE